MNHKAALLFLLVLVLRESYGRQNLILTWTSVKDIHSYEAALGTVRDYAEVHDYDRVVNVSQYDFATDRMGLCNGKAEEEVQQCRGRAGYWFKVHVLRDICRLGEHGHILVLDADVAINRPELSLEYFTHRGDDNKGAGPATVFAAFMGARVNSGVFLIAGGAECLRFTDTWLAQHGWYADDNGAFNHALLAYRNPSYNGRCASVVAGMAPASWSSLQGANPSSEGSAKQQLFAEADGCLMGGYNLTYGRDPTACGRCSDTRVGEAVVLLCPHSSVLRSGIQAEGPALARLRGRHCIKPVELQLPGGTALAHPTCHATHSFAVHSKQLKGCRDIKHCIGKICTSDVSAAAAPLLAPAMSNPAAAEGAVPAAETGVHIAASVPSNVTVVPISFTEWHLCRMYDEALDGRGKTRHLRHIGRFVFGDFDSQIAGTGMEREGSGGTYSYYLPVEFKVGRRGRNFDLEDSRSLLRLMATRPQELSLEAYHAFVEGEGWRELLRPCAEQLMPVYYWNSKKGGGWSITNFGDAVNVDIARGLLTDGSPGAEPRVTSKGKQQKGGNAEQKLLVAGSVLLNANPGDLVWGTGLQFDTNATYSFPHSGGLDVRATRGPLAASVLGAISATSHPHLAFGDPALLLPLFVQAQARAPGPENERYYCVVPHYVDIEGVKLTPRQKKIAATMPDRLVFPIKKPMRQYQDTYPVGVGRDGHPLRLRVLSPGLSSREMVEAMVGQCELVLSSSLHGVIFAEMYHIPARWLYNPELLLSSRVESSLKYNDYFLSTGRSCYEHATSLADGLAIGGFESYSPQRWAALAQQLLVTFPHERVCAHEAAAPPNFNAYPHQASFIRAVRQLQVPGFEDAFNPSIVMHAGRPLLSFRTRRRQAYGAAGPDANTLGLVYLQGTGPDSFTVGAQDRPWVLEFVNPYSKQQASRAHDPRLVVDPTSGHLMVVYSNLFALALPSKGKPRMVQTRRMFLSRVDFARNASSGANIPVLDAELGGPQVISRFDLGTKALEQKNWVPFEHEGETMFVQTMEPHQVVTLRHESLTELTADVLHVSRQQLGWEWGELRGGTPAVLLPPSLTAAGAVGPDLLAFFHSSRSMRSAHSDGAAVQHYFMGAYTFEANPPFRVTRISREPVFAPGMYDPSHPGLQHKTYKPIRCVFPTGLLLDATRMEAHVTFGKQDFEAWVATMGLEELIRDHLRPV